MLKKLFLILTFLLVLMGLWLTTAIPIFSGEADRYEVSVDSSSSARLISVNKEEVVFKSGIKGLSFNLTEKNFDLKDFLDKYDAKIVFSERVADGVSYYAISPQLKYKKRISGKEVNLHINISSDNVTIGSPIIFGGF